MIDHSKNPAVQQIDADTATVTSAKQAAEGERDRAALAQRAGDKAAGKRLAELTTELASYTAQLDTLAAARRAAVNDAAAEFGQHRADVLAQNIADALAASKQRVESAARIEKAVSDLGKALEQHNASGVLAWSALSKCSALVGGIEHVLGLKDSAVGNGSASAASVALFHVITRANDLGGACVRVDFPGLNSSAVGSVVEDAKKDAERIARATAGWVVAAEPDGKPVRPAVAGSVPRVVVKDGVSMLVGSESAVIE